jgi:hypothetical protein
MTKKLAENFATAQASVTAVASKIVTGQFGVDTNTIQNTGSVPVYVGPSNAVTPSTGFPIPANGALTMETTADVWAITASGTSTVAILTET